MVTIDTTRFSTVIAAFVERYPDAVAKLDKRKQASSVGQWCTNVALLRAINFSLTRGGVELLGFHDGPRNMWASIETLPLVEELAAQRVLRFKVAEVASPSLLSRLFSGLLGRRNAG